MAAHRRKINKNYGYYVTLIELAPMAVEFAKKNMKTLYKTEVGDARFIDKHDNSADVILLMDPMYNLQDRSECEKVLNVFLG